MSLKKDMRSAETNQSKEKRKQRSFLGPSSGLQFEDPNEKTMKETHELTVKFVDISKIRDNTENHFDVTNLFFLEKSIENNGMVQNLLLQQIVEDGIPTGMYEIKVGSRRFACLNNLYRKAIVNNDKEAQKKFSKAFSVIIPLGATEKEIKDLIAETNTTQRQLSVKDLFNNFDVVFEKDENNDFKYIPKGKNKYESISQLIKDMGYDFSPSSVKDYVSIYTAHNPQIRQHLEDGFLSKRQALIVSRMDSREQDEVLKKFESMTEKEIAQFLKDYASQKKNKETNKIRGADALNEVSKATDKMHLISLKKEIVFADDFQKAQVRKKINEMKTYIETLENLLKS